MFRTILLSALAVLTSCSGTPKKEVGALPSGIEKVEYEAAVVQAIETSMFRGLDGAEVALSDYRGKVVMLDFWETWCGPCLRAFPNLDRLMREYPDDFAVLAITPGFSDTEEDVKAFRRDNPAYPFTFVLDQGLSDRLNIEGIPFKVFVSAEGKYLTSIMGAYPDDYEKIRALIEKFRSN